MRGALALLLVGGCGRYAFDEHAVPDAAPDADGMVPADAPAMMMTVTFGESSSATVRGVTADTYVSGEVDPIAGVDERPFNFGNAIELRIDRMSSNRTLLRFELSSIPTTATVIDARLDVFVTRAELSGVVSLRRALEDWSEGAGDGTDGVANFAMRTDTSAWSSPGANEPASAGAEVGAFSPAVLGATSVPLSATVVQGWVADPASNFGVVLIGDGDNRSEVSSSEGPDAQRPLLIVTYVE